ncbi:hypothetical protein SAMN04488558_1291, partial [Ignavigranum ruoffiae]
KDLVISYPKNIKEQKKIGEVSFSLNETITLHQRQQKRTPLKVPVP